MLGSCWSSDDYFSRYHFLMSLDPSTHIHLPRPFQWRTSVSTLFPTLLSLLLSPNPFLVLLLLLRLFKIQHIYHRLSYDFLTCLSQDSTHLSPVASLSSSPEFISMILARILPSFPRFYIHRPRVVNASNDVPLPLSAYL